MIQITHARHCSGRWPRFHYARRPECGAVRQGCLSHILKEPGPVSERTEIASLSLAAGANVLNTLWVLPEILVMMTKMERLFGAKSAHRSEVFG